MADAQKGSIYIIGALMEKRHFPYLFLVPGVVHSGTALMYTEIHSAVPALPQYKFIIPVFMLPTNQPKVG